MTTLVLRPGAVVVLEGLDAAGKTTQVDLLKRAVDSASVTFVHMPTGFSAYSRILRYALDDRELRPKDALAQQLGHLSSHAEAMAGLVEIPTRQALVLDRWWWSTMAYGWYGADLASKGIHERDFRGLINSIWGGIEPDLILLFLHPYGDDENNSPKVLDGYRALASENSRTVIAPQADEGFVHDWVLNELVVRGLATPQ